MMMCFSFVSCVIRAIRLGEEEEVLVVVEEEVEEEVVVVEQNVPLIQGLTP
jgi:hypothetical protein